MAANLNARLAQQKGIGPTQLLSDILSEPHGNRLKSGPLARVLLPAALGGRSVTPKRQEKLARVLGLDSKADLDSKVETILKDLPYANRLSELGLTHEDIVSASDKINDPIGNTVQTTAASARSIMEAVL